MTLKDKIIFALLTIFTLGIYPIIIFNKKSKKTSEKLSEAQKISININELKKLLGGKSNILGCEYTHTKIKFFIKSREDINLEDIKNLKGVSGIASTSKSISIIVGNQAKAITKELIKWIN